MSTEQFNNGTIQQWIPLLFPPNCPYPLEGYPPRRNIQRIWLAENIGGRAFPVWDRGAVGREENSLNDIYRAFRPVFFCGGFGSRLKAGWVGCWGVQNTTINRGAILIGCIHRVRLQTMRLALWFTRVSTVHTQPPSASFSGLFKFLT
mgnify:CR=1 FL=1